MKRFPSIVTSVAALALGTGGVAHAQDSIPLLPRGLLFGHPDRAAPRISPDGTQLSFLAPVNGVLNIWVGSINDPYQAVPVTELKEHGIRSYTWAYTNEHILYANLPLASATTYRVTIVGTHSGGALDLSWTFTTR